MPKTFRSSASATRHRPLNRPRTRLASVLGLLAAVLFCAPPSTGQALVLDSAGGNHNVLKMIGSLPYLSFCANEACAGSDYIGFLWGQQDVCDPPAPGCDARHLSLGTGTGNTAGSIRFYLHNTLAATLSDAGFSVGIVNANAMNITRSFGPGIKAVSTASAQGAIWAIGDDYGDAPGVGIYATGHHGVWGMTTGSVSGQIAIRGSAYQQGATAGLFQGDVDVEGTLTKGGGAFRIDHPLEPATKFLYHSFVESPDMKNIYDGVVETDASGEAWVELPKWFEALNRDFRYQLTVIGRFVQAIVAEEIEDNRFLVQTEEPGVKVSWQVTGIRQDPYAEVHRIPIEEDKPREELGRYLYPELYGAPPEMAINWRPQLQ